MKSWPELIGSGNPENGDYLAGLREDKPLIVTADPKPTTDPDGLVSYAQSLERKIERLVAALKVAREYVVRIDGTMAFTSRENRLTKPDLDLIDAALKE